jgi:2-hydroxychromene-2-carboxylate isomerase
MKRKLLSLYVQVILDKRFITLRRSLTELRRKLTFKKRVVSVFLQLDDPYSYLLSYYLEHVITRYKKVEFRFYLCQALSGDYMPQPGMLADYAMADCAALANEFGVPFLDVGSTPAVEYRRALLDFLGEEHDEKDFPETFIKALSAYWRGDPEGVARIVGRAQAELSETNVLIGQNQLLLRKMGHYNCATMHYAGEWYWGVDRLHYLIERFDQQGLNRFKEPIPELASLQQAMQLKLPVTQPVKAASLPPLEIYYSFRSPYAYLALSRTYEIADAFGLKLEVKPVLPMVMRGLKVPKAKLLYIVKDANREAERLEVQFGKVADSVGDGAERCIAAFYYAKSEGRERDYLLAAGQAIFAGAIDVATDEGMEIVADRSGLFWPDLKEALEKEEWRAWAKENRDALTEAGLWGVQSFLIGDVVIWGQDRDWLLARKIEDMCHDGEGIIV